MKNQDAQVEFEEPPGHGRPSHPWEDVSLTSEEVAGLSPLALLRVGITPYSASLMGHDDSKCPISRQIVPTALEPVPFKAQMTDSLAEDVHSSVPGLVHRYPDRVLMLITTQRADYCRFSIHNRIVGNADAQSNTADRMQIDIPLLLNTEVER